MNSYRVEVVALVLGILGAIGLIPVVETGNTRIEVTTSNVEGVSYSAQYEREGLFGLTTHWKDINEYKYGYCPLHLRMGGDEERLACAKQTIDEYIEKGSETTKKTYIKYP